jgi:hypothetical protein
LKAALVLYRDRLGWEGGFVASFEDPSGNVIYVLDQSRDAAVAQTT